MHQEKEYRVLILEWNEDEDAYETLQDFGGGEIPVVLWRFHEAPEALKRLTPNHDDKDWLIWAPESYRDALYVFDHLDSMYEPDVVDLPNGDQILICGHA